MQDAFWGILIPFLGTSLGAGCVFFLKNALRDGIQRASPALPPELWWRHRYGAC